MLCMRKKFESGEDWPVQREDLGNGTLDRIITGNSTQCSVVT